MYSSIKKDIRPKTTVYDRIRTMKYLIGNKCQYMTARHISEELGFKAKNNSVQLRKVITELIEYHDAPIIASTKGFRLSLNVDDIDEYIVSLRLRDKGIKRRIRGVQRARDNIIKKTTKK